MDIPRPKQKKYGRIYAAIGGIVGLALVTLALSRLKPAPPSVPAGQVWPDTVKRGPMVRDVRGPGTLVPENMHYISAVTGGRIEHVFVQPGATVQPGTVLMDFSNPDEELKLLSDQQQLAAAEAQLVNLRTSLEGGRLSQQQAVVNVRTQLRDAQRTLDAAEALNQRNPNLIAANELQRDRDQVEQLTSQLAIEQQRLTLMASTVDSQITLQRDQVMRLRAILDFQQARVGSMRVAAGVAGVLVQDQLWQPGQYVQSGTTLGRIVQPGHLKAVLRIPETQARDVAVGQSADIDTHLGDARVGHVTGHVTRMDAGSTNGTVGVDVSLDGQLPEGARPDLSVEGVITLERLANVLYMGRPAYGQANSQTSIFRVENNGDYADRVNVQLGRGSVNQMEIVSGLKEGDVVILSDMSRFENVDRVKIK